MMSGDVFVGHCWISLNRSRNMKKDMMYTTRPAGCSSLCPGLCGHLVNLFVYVSAQLVSLFSQAQAQSSLRYAITYFEGEGTLDSATSCRGRVPRLLNLLLLFN